MAPRKHLQVRLPPLLHAKLVGAARAARRSLNSEIVWRLEALTEPGQPKPGSGIAPRLGGSPPAGEAQGHDRPGSVSASGLSSEPFEEAP